MLVGLLLGYSISIYVDVDRIDQHIYPFYGGVFLGNTTDIFYMNTLI